MDSMRNLHKSLPGSTAHKGQKLHNPPEDILQSFKAAALSVTNLYKRAANDLVAERKAGYQDAIFDLLSFLDKQNLGLETGEGWQVRQWATERQDTGPNNHTASDEEEGGDEIRDDSNQAAEDDASQSEEAAAEHEGVGCLPRCEPQPSESMTRASGSVGASQLPQSETFTFQSSVPYPEVDMDLSPTAPSPGVRPSTALSRTDPASRTPRRRGQSQKQVIRQRPSGAGLGMKRKLQFNDFFDLGSLSSGKGIAGGGSGPKRSRPV